MQKNILGASAVLVLVLAMGFMLVSTSVPESEQAPTPLPVLPKVESMPQNATYTIAGRPLTLTAGSIEVPVAPGSASVERTMIFGEPKMGDLDKDGDEDAVLFLVQNSSGSGTFYYVALAINDGGVYKGTNALLLGDRIAPQTVGIIDGRAVANFAVRKAGEPFTAQPSVGKSMWVHLDPRTGEIGEWVKDFEGEADASKMTLTMATWEWVKMVNKDGKTTLPAKPDVFTMTLKADNTVALTTDCNGGGGEYQAKVDTLTFGALFSTMMYCEGSQEQEFTSALGEVQSYKFTSRGELLLALRNGGTMTFRGK